MLLKQFLVFK